MKLSTLTKPQLDKRFLKLPEDGLQHNFYQSHSVKKFLATKNPIVNLQTSMAESKNIRY